MSADNLKVWFPIKRGLLRTTVGHIKAVDGVSLAVRKGETLGVVGESGSGKTTLGLALLRLISSDGPIVFLGSNIQGLRFKDMLPFRRDMQIVFQDPFGSLSPRMSVGDIVAEGLSVHQKSLSYEERETRVVKALKDVGLDPETRFRYPHEFSGGQRQRISIARAVVLEPNFVVLDEPTSALDMLFQAQMVDLLRELQRKRDLTYMFISHDLRVVASLASHLIVMRHGKVVEEGPAAELFKNPKSDYTRALFAAAFRIEAVPDLHRYRNECHCWHLGDVMVSRQRFAPSRSIEGSVILDPRMRTLRASRQDEAAAVSSSRLIAVTSLPAALIRAIASRVFSITVAM